MKTTNLRFALPKGRMSEQCLEHLKHHNLISFDRWPQTRQLILTDDKAGIEFILVRSGDVGTYVEQGCCDLGVVGHDLLTEHDYDVHVPMELPYGHCELCVAYPENKEEWKSRKNIKIATKYPGITSRYFFNKGFNAQIIQLYGSIEIAPLTGISDAIVDLVSTGKTLQENKLTKGEVILKSQARLIMNRSSYAFKKREIIKIIDTLTTS